MTKDTEGDFKCEIVADYPSYERDSAIAPLEVTGKFSKTTREFPIHFDSTVLPHNKPEITLEKPFYQLGEHLRANCTADAGDRLPTLVWYLNGKKARSKKNKNITWVL